MTDHVDEPQLHARWMNEAIALARTGMREHGGGPFGAVVVFNNEIVGRGWNQVTHLLDPTAHAEVIAIRDACQELKRFELRGCVLYTSCEPCPMCLSAIYWSRLDRVYFASTRKDAAGIGFDDDFIYQQIPLELTARSLPMIQLPTAAAADLFAEWAANPDKIPY
ncbi:MAG TPA: nucleoside deaminase [Chthoniobacterales bacterium]|nr:nucleoside deaminase [Chthoniobacterales bacterium]